MEQVTLRTERLLIRPWTPDDAYSIFEACQDEEIQRWTTIPSPYEQRHAEGFVHEISPQGWERGVSASFGAFLLGEHPMQLVASVSVDNIRRNADTGGRTGSIGYWVAAPSRGKGYATEAVREVARWALTESALCRLDWTALSGNTASWHVARAVGFRFLGTAPKSLRNGTRDAWTAALDSGSL